MISSGIEPATFRLVVICHNQLLSRMLSAKCTYGTEILHNSAHIECVPEVMRPGCEAEHPLLASVEMKNAWIYPFSHTLIS
jgi:hypothetical protein